MTRKKKPRPFDYDLAGFWLDEGLDPENRIIRLCAGIDDDTAHRFVALLHLLEQHNHDDITIWLDTGGGAENAGIVIIDAILASPCSIDIVVLGAAWSMGAIILQAARHRSMRRNASLMIHAGSRSYEGLAENVRQEIMFDKVQDDVCDRLLLRRMQERQPNMTLGELRDLMTTDRYIFAEEAVKMGLIDEVIS